MSLHQGSKKMPSSLVDDSRAFLQKVDEGGVSLHGHITEVLARILTAQPDNALDALEAVSLEAKASYFDAASSLAPPEPSAELERPGDWQVNTNALLMVRGQSRLSCRLRSTKPTLHTHNRCRRATPRWRRTIHSSSRTSSRR